MDNMISFAVLSSHAGAIRFAKRENEANVTSKDLKRPCTASSRDVTTRKRSSSNATIKYSQLLITISSHVRKFVSVGEVLVCKLRCACVEFVIVRLSV